MKMQLLTEGFEIGKVRILFLFYCFIILLFFGQIFFELGEVKQSIKVKKEKELWESDEC